MSEQPQKHAVIEPSGQVILPFKEDDFREFIRSLLGKPQEISKVIAGSFDLNIDDLKGFHNLITQRIQQQNKATLVQFSARIAYSDDSSVRLGSFPELETYNEVRAVISKAIHMTWIFLIKFEDKNVPEKQEISISILTSDIDYQEIRSRSGRVVRVSNSDGGGQFVISIKHTARTWGADIEGLISGYIKSLLKIESGVHRFIHDKSGLIGLSVFLLWFFASILASIQVTKWFARHQIELTESILKKSGLGNELTLLSKKVDLLIEYFAGGEWNNFSLMMIAFILVSLMLAIVFGIWSGIMASSFKEPSFLSLTKESIKHRDHLKDKQKHNWRSLLISLSTAVFTSLCARFAFAYITGVWKP